MCKATSIVWEERESEKKENVTNKHELIQSVVIHPDGCMTYLVQEYGNLEFQIKPNGIKRVELKIIYYT